MTIKHENPKLEWAKLNEPACEWDGNITGHFCQLKKYHKSMKHSCSCGREWYDSEQYKLFLANATLGGH